MTEKKNDGKGDFTKITTISHFDIVGAVNWARVEGEIRVEWDNKGKFKIRDASGGNIHVTKIIRDFQIGTDGANSAADQIALFLNSSEQLFGKDKNIRVTIEEIDSLTRPAYDGLL